MTFPGNRSKSKQDTNRTNRTQSSGEKHESARFWGSPPGLINNITLVMHRG